MAIVTGHDDDSLTRTGGQIPGSNGAPAFVISGPSPSAIPVLIAVPHAGRAYPGSLLERMRNPGFAALRLEDRYVDLLAVEVAKATGATLLVANAPRAMIDLNRAADDIDWEMFGRRPDGLVEPAKGAPEPPVDVLQRLFHRLAGGRVLRAQGLRFFAERVEQRGLDGLGHGYRKYHARGRCA